jgi:hypothetical protein
VSDLMPARLFLLRLVLLWILFIGPRRPSNFAPVLRPDY